MKLTCTITANTKKALIIVNDDNSKTYTTSCVKQSSGRWAINLEKIEDAPQKWILVPGKPGSLEDMTFTRDFDKVKEYGSKVAKATSNKVQPTLAQWLESVVAQVAAHPDLTDDEVISITGAIKPILDKIKVADEKKKLEQQITETKSQLEAMIAQLAKLSE